VRFQALFMLADLGPVGHRQDKLGWLTGTGQGTEAMGKGSSSQQPGSVSMPSFLPLRQAHQNNSDSPPNDMQGRKP
jgi:hypothetical protein